MISGTNSPGARDQTGTWSRNLGNVLSKARVSKFQAIRYLRSERFVLLICLLVIARGSKCLLSSTGNQWKNRIANDEGDATKAQALYTVHCCAPWRSKDAKKTV